MKNRIAVLFFSIVIIVGILSGCTKQPPLDNTNPPPKPAEPSAILELKQPMGDSDNLFYIPNETVESGLMQTLLYFKNDFLLCTSNQDGFFIKRISSDTGEVLDSNIFPDIIMPNVQVCGDKIAVTDWFDGKILIIDEHLQELNHYKVTCEYNSVYVSPDASKAYTFLPEDGLQITTLATGETETLLERTINLYISDAFNTKVTFSYTDLDSQFDMCGAIDLETGKLIEFPFEGAFFNLCIANDTWFATQQDTLDSHFVGNRDVLKTFKLKNETGHFTMCPDTGNLLMTSYSEIGFDKMAIYDTNGNFISECVNNLEGTVVQGDPFWSEVDGGYYFIMIDPAGKDILMFWDVNADCSGENLPFQDFEEGVLPEGAVSKELYARAKELGETNGITIRIAEQIPDEYAEYKAETCLDEKLIANALEDVEKVLDTYPKGFFKQLIYGSVHKIELHLTGAIEMTLLPEDTGNGFTSFAGFASSFSGYSLIVLDIYSSVESNLHHEIFHIIDYKLAFDAQIHPESIYSEENWSKLNPEGFEYAGQLHNLPDSFYTSEYDEWFTGSYARTYPMEDRATIMEYAGIGDHNMFIHAPYRQAKLEYLINCIRDAFDTTGWPEETVWEDTLNRSR